MPINCYEFEIDFGKYFLKKKKNKYIPIHFTNGYFRFIHILLHLRTLLNYNLFFTLFLNLKKFWTLFTSLLIYSWVTTLHTWNGAPFLSRFVDCFLILLVFVARLALIYCHINDDFSSLTYHVCVDICAYIFILLLVRLLYHITLLLLRVRDNNDQMMRVRSQVYATMILSMVTLV